MSDDYMSKARAAAHEIGYLRGVNAAGQLIYQAALATADETARHQLLDLATKIFQLTPPGER
jgi:hypothetical protein